jgi:hypothetical protein
MSIGWENACQGKYAGKNVYYTISFIVAMEVGTDLGEDTFDSRGTAGSNLPPCAPGDYASVDVEPPPPPPPTWTRSEYQATLVPQIPWEGYIPYTGVFPPPDVVYTGRPAEEWEVEKFSNPNAFPIFILKPGMAATKCFAQDAGVILQTWGSTSATELYDVKTLHAPIALMACIASGTLVPNANRCERQLSSLRRDFVSICVVGRKLGLRYVLEGSVRKVGGRPTRWRAAEPCVELPVPSNVSWWDGGRVTRAKEPLQRPAFRICADAFVCDESFLPEI